MALSAISDTTRGGPDIDVGWGFIGKRFVRTPGDFRFMPPSCFISVSSRFSDQVAGATTYGAPDRPAPMAIEAFCQTRSLSRSRVDRTARKLG